MFIKQSKNMWSFLTLSPGVKIFMLNREPIPNVCEGEVVSVSPPRQNPNNWQQMSVNVVAKIDGKETTFENLPSDKCMADSRTGIQLYCDKDSMIDDIKKMRRDSAQILEDVDKHKAVVSACDNILLNLCPEVAEKAAREKELELMRSQLAEMREMFRKVMEKSKE